MAWPLPGPRTRPKPADRRAGTPAACSSLGGKKRTLPSTHPRSHPFPATQTSDDAKAKATKAAKTVKKNTHTKARKVRTSVVFHRPKTLKLARNPKFPRQSAPGRAKLDAFEVVKMPLTTESAMKKIEENNTLVFLVDVRSTKAQIKAAVASLYDAVAARVNTLIRPDGAKKAYVRLAPDHDALDVANKIGII